MRPVQYFSDEYLAHCRAMSPQQIAVFLEDFRLLNGRRGKASSRLISLRVPAHLLEAFRKKAALTNVPYQTQIKRLMSDWLGADRAAD
ncbi:MAG: hypothetical protein HY554_10580 [Elusimicrobia bacterium]|nr:hypothetical protein [Elusimicrobiota bacterium]